MPIQHFTDLDSWKKAHSFTLEAYKITKHFPNSEQFGLTNQIQRASISITSNIAEGFARAGKKEKIHFYSISAGSTSEVQSQMILAKDLGYINTHEFNHLFNKSSEVYKLINSLIRSTRSRKNY